MNSFGHNFRVTIFGESHGPAVGVVLDGVPAGLPLSETDFDADLKRRQGGTMKGTTPRKEADQPVFLSGIFNGYATGSPLTIIFENKNTKSSDYDQARDIPRPGHSDFVASKKFKGFNDHRGGGHFSGRLTLCLVAAGVVAKKLLGKTVSVTAIVAEAGGDQNIDAAVEKATVNGDSIGGIVECRVKGLPLGLGEPFFNSMESMISHAVFAIPAVKGIEFGAGFAATKMTGSMHNDALENETGITKTNHAGGITGGITNGNELFFRVAVKPASSTPAIQTSLNLKTGVQEEFAVQGRHDLCIALRVPPVLEAVTAMVLADLQQYVSA